MKALEREGESEERNETIQQKFLLRILFSGDYKRNFFHRRFSSHFCCGFFFCWRNRDVGILIISFVLFLFKISGRFVHVKM